MTRPWPPTADRRPDAGRGRRPGVAGERVVGATQELVEQRGPLGLEAGAGHAGEARPPPGRTRPPRRCRSPCMARTGARLMRASAAEPSQACSVSATRMARRSCSTEVRRSLASRATSPRAAPGDGLGFGIRAAGRRVTARRLGEPPEDRWRRVPAPVEPARRAEMASASAASGALTLRSSHLDPGRRHLVRVADGPDRQAEQPWSDRRHRESADGVGLAQLGPAAVVDLDHAGPGRDDLADQPAFGRPRPRSRARGRRPWPRS